MLRIIFILCAFVPEFYTGILLSPRKLLSPGIHLNYWQFVNCMSQLGSDLILWSYSLWFTSFRGLCLLCKQGLFCSLGAHFWSNAPVSSLLVVGTGR